MAKVEIFDMNETLDLFRPTKIEIDKGIRYLRSLGLPSIGITVQGDVYNSNTKRYMTNRQSYIFSVNNKSVGFTKNYLIKIAFKYDLEDPSKILDLKDKDLETDVYMTWDFWNNQKNYLITDLLDSDSLGSRVNEGIISNFMYNSIGLYNIRYEKYQNIDANGLYQISTKHNGKRTKANLVAKKLHDGLVRKENQIENQIENTETKIDSANIKTTENINMKNSDKNESAKTVKTSKFDKQSILEFINDTLTLNLDELSAKYNVAKQILKVIKTED